MKMGGIVMDCEETFDGKKILRESSRSRDVSRHGVEDV